MSDFEFRQRLMLAVLPAVIARLDERELADAMPGSASAKRIVGIAVALVIEAAPRCKPKETEAKST